MVMATKALSFDTPYHAPTMKDDALSVLRLIRSRKVGPATFHRLLAEHGSATAALSALPALAAEAGIGDYATYPLSAAQAELAAGHRAGAHLLTWLDEDYPAQLRQIGDAPPVLWVKGDVAVLKRPGVAVIGARNASSLGLRMARGMAGGLAQSGSIVIAGLARGIDTVAHEASLTSGTIAVMAGGIDMIYPSENAALAEEICDTGLLVTEQPPGTEPVARHFPARNRIISGLASAVVVIEAAHRSGSLITARCALDQGREVMAVPGHPMDARAAGCNALIRDGALLVRNSADVLAALEAPAAVTVSEQPLAVASPQPAPTASIVEEKRSPMRGLQPAAVAKRLAALGHAVHPITRGGTGGPAALEARILSRLSPSPTEENHLVRDLGLPAAMLAPALLELELSGQVQRLPGGRIALT